MDLADLPHLTRAEIAALSPETRQAILALAVPRLPEPYIPHAPHPPQQLFLMDQRREAFYGGAAGGGKSDALLMAAMQYVDVPGYSALIIRRTYADLSLPGAVMVRATEWLSDSDAKSHDGGRWWSFPSGARLTFGYLQYPRDVSQYKSAEFQMIGWDELTQFAQGSYTFMFSRLRKPSLACEDCPVKVEKVGKGQRSRTRTGKTGDEIADGTGWVHVRGQTNYRVHCTLPRPNRRALAEYPPSLMDGTTLFDVPLRVRSASNPGDLGHAWVRDRFIDPMTKIKTASFYPARLTDNPSLDQESYAESLSHLNAVDRARLLGGDWDVEEGGLIFKRSWFEAIDLSAVPAEALRKPVRYWDFAATKVRASGDRSDPDYTAGAKLGRADGVTFILDLVRVRDDPAVVESTVRVTASQDGKGTRVRLEQEPGSSGKIVLDHYRRHVLVGYNVDKLKPTTAKEERAKLWASAAGAGNVKIVRGEWNQAFLDECSAFPYATHDDQVDAVSGAFECLSRPEGTVLV